VKASQLDGSDDFAVIVGREEGAVLCPVGNKHQRQGRRKAMVIGEKRKKSGGMINVNSDTSRSLANLGMNAQVNTS